MGASPVFFVGPFRDGGSWPPQRVARFTVPGVEIPALRGGKSIRRAGEQVKRVPCVCAKLKPQVRRTDHKGLIAAFSAPGPGRSTAFHGVVSRAEIPDPGTPHPFKSPSRDPRTLPARKCPLSPGVVWRGVAREVVIPLGR